MNARYKVVVFDIGNVVIDIDYQKTLDAFRILTGIDFSHLVTLHKQDEFFNRYERGEISTAAFLSLLKKEINNPAVTDAHLITAWNALLTDYPEERFLLLEKLKQNYITAALSNINDLHLQEIDRAVAEKFGKPDLAHYFHHTFYSHEMGMRKPESRIYEQVLSQLKVTASEVLFLDDKKENTEAAAALGIHTLHITEKNQIIRIFAE